jgi:hypothetical protein
MLLVLDNLTGHLTPSFVLWLFDHGIMPLYTPLSGSWLNLPKGHPRNRSSASSRDGHWWGITRRRRRRSSPGWKRLRKDGTEQRHRSSGVGSGRRDGSALGSVATRSGDQGRAPHCRCTGSTQHEDMAMTNPTDPLGDRSGEGAGPAPPVAGLSLVSAAAAPSPCSPRSGCSGRSLHLPCRPPKARS